MATCPPELSYLTPEGLFINYVTSLTNCSSRCAVDSSMNRDVVYLWLQTWVQLGPHVGKTEKKKKKEKKERKKKEKKKKKKKLCNIYSGGGCLDWNFFGTMMTS